MDADGGGEDKAEAGAAAARRASARMPATRVKIGRRGAGEGWKRVGEPRLLPRRGKVVVVDVCESKPCCRRRERDFTQAVLHVHGRGSSVDPDRLARTCSARTIIS